MLAALLCAWRGPFGCPVAHAQSFKDVPGVVLPGSHEPSPASMVLFGRVWVYGSPKIYTTSPSIVVLPDGDYVVASNIFGRDSGARVSGTTKLWRSGDKGLTWTPLTGLNHMKRGSLFVYEGDLHIWGYTAAPGAVVVRRSADKGETWTEPEDDAGGRLTGTANWGGTPHHPVVHHNRIWMAQGGTRAFSAPLGADLLQSKVWNRTPSADVRRGPLGSSLTVTEAQVVASPETGVVVMPKVGGLPNSVLLRTGPDPETIADPLDEDWVALPGGEKKFGAGYDPVSGRFFILSNPVLAAHVSEREPPALVRNTAAVLSSANLRHWNVEAIFLYSPNVDYEGFQYLNFAIDAGDLAVVSRTAFDVGGHKPPRGHDSNLITFHRIPDFRNLQRDHRLRLVNGTVRRFEKTQHRDAPLGAFALGNCFDGSPLGAAADFAVCAEKDAVYIREQEGRILQFDAAGNYLETVDVAPQPLRSVEQAVPQPPPDEAVWIAPGSGTWRDVMNWYYWRKAVTPGDTAVFGSAARGPATVSLPACRRTRRFEQSATFERDGLRMITEKNGIRVGGLRFRNQHAYTLSGREPLHLNPSEGPARIRVEVGSHQLDAPLAVHSDMLLELADSTELELRQPVTGLGNWMVSGPGRMTLSLPEAGMIPMIVQGDMAINPNTELGIRLPVGLSPQRGQTFTLIRYDGELSGLFLHLEEGRVLEAEGYWFSISYATPGEVRLMLTDKP